MRVQGPGRRPMVRKRRESRSRVDGFGWLAGEEEDQARKSVGMKNVHTVSFVSFLLRWQQCNPSQIGKIATSASNIRSLFFCSLPCSLLHCTLVVCLSLHPSIQSVVAFVFPMFAQGVSSKVKRETQQQDPTQAKPVIQQSSQRQGPS